MKPPVQKVPGEERKTALSSLPKYRLLNQVPAAEGCRSPYGEGVTRPDEEAPVADAVEQATPANPIDAADDETEAPTRGLEVPEWDAAEQSIVVPIEDEDAAVIEDDATA